MEDDAERILALRRQEDDEDDGYPGYYDLTERRELEERMEKKRERVRKRKKQFGNIVPQSHGDDVKQMKREEIKPKKNKEGKMSLFCFSLIPLHLLLCILLQLP